MHTKLSWLGYCILFCSLDCAFHLRVPPPFLAATPGTMDQCGAFNSLSANSQRCVANAACDGVICSFLGFRTAVTTLPCHSPPAVYVIVQDSNGTTLFSQIIDRTQQVPLVGGTTLRITLDQLTGGIGLMVWHPCVLSWQHNVH